MKSKRKVRMDKKLELCLYNLFEERVVNFLKAYLKENKLLIVRDTPSPDEFLKVYLEANRMKIVEKYPDRKGVDSRGRKKDVWLNNLAKRLTGEARASWQDGENVWYLGGGYWRVQQDKDDECLFWLINPSLNHEQLDIVEKAMNIISF
jgi:hypothetical protein